MRPEDYGDYHRNMGRDQIGNTPTTYVLECETLDPVFAPDYAVDRIGRAPDWVETAARHKTVKYVGATEHPFRRIGEHFAGNGAVFTQVFEPVKVVKLEFYDSIDAAKEREVDMTVESNNNVGDYYYSN